MLDGACQRATGHTARTSSNRWYWASKPPRRSTTVAAPPIPAACTIKPSASTRKGTETRPPSSSSLAEHHRIGNFIAGILLPHQNKTLGDPYIRTVMAQMGAIESTL
ncbi:hypothetical protein ABT009_21965 [Streptomyces sp. NPDC002896]|uniref:hypothetical protein n=1 Tax=Streptomyces sp. NPDC002896 TaxID=3154438 RepID=UPI00332BD85B